MKIIKHIVSVILACTVAVGSVVSVYAAESTASPKPTASANAKKSSGSATKFKEELTKFLGTDVTSEDIYNWSVAISSLKTDGLTDEGIAGVLGNMRAECGSIGAYAIEGLAWKETVDGKSAKEFEEGGTYKYTCNPNWYYGDNGNYMGGCGHGICQWSFSLADELSEFAKSHDFGKVTVTHKLKSWDSGEYTHTCYIPNMTGQVLYFLESIGPGKERSYVKDVLISTDNVNEAAQYFHDKYEISAEKNIGERQEYARLALPAVKACDKVSGTSPRGKQDTEALALELVGLGLWDESQFVTFVDLAELDITMPDRSHLSYDNLRRLEEWKQISDYRNMESLGSVPRVVLMIVGIAICVYALVLYLMFWVDSINNIFDFEGYKLLTFNRLAVSPDGKSTFKSKGAGMKCVIHKDAVFISLVAIALGLLLISGGVFDVVSNVRRIIQTIIE